MQKIMPCLWFDHQAEEAANFYASIFEDSKILDIARYGEGGPMPAGTVLTVTLTLQGQEFMVLNGGPYFQFSPAISFYVNCESQEEVDRLWEGLLDGGEEEQCGWLKDRYGVSWQIVPTVLGEMMNDPDPEKVKRVTSAMLKMVKLDIAGLERAYAGD